MRQLPTIALATSLALATSIALAGCAEAERDEVPEVAEVETEPLSGEVDLNEEPSLGFEDLGKTIMANGWVTGTTLDNGFFLLTEDDAVVFVNTTASVSTGDAVRVIGPLAEIGPSIFNEWEAGAFEGGFEAGWDVETSYYIDATTVTPIQDEDGQGS